MSKVFVNIGLSLDGYMAPEGMTMGRPEYKNWGTKWGAMMAWILNQRYLCHGQNGQGTIALNGTDPTTSSARNIRPHPRPYGAGP